MRLPSRARKRPNTKMSIPAPASGPMPFSAKLSAALLTLATLPACALAQTPHLPRAQTVQTPRVSQLPATPPTTLPQQPTAPAAPANAAAASTTDCTTPPCAATSDNGAPKPTKPHHASVTFSNGELTVAASDSSLHQILRSIATQTGMTITGGVEEQRVFGTYGPSDPATILATLLDGTGVNMLLKDGPGHVPTALILTQRTGGPSPAPITADDEKIGADELSVVAAPAPSPKPVPPPQPASPIVTAAPAISVAPSPQPTQPVQAGQPQPGQALPGQPAQQVVTAPAPSTPPSIPQPANNVLGSPNNVTPTASQIPTTNSVPLDALPTPSTTVQTQQGIVDTPNPPPAGSAPTPDSIYQQLLQLQKAKAAAPAGTNGAPPPATPPQ